MITWWVFFVAGSCRSGLGLCECVCDRKLQRDFSLSHWRQATRAGVLISSPSGAEAPVLLHHLNELAVVQGGCWVLAELQQQEGGRVEKVCVPSHRNTPFSPNH